MATDFILLAAFLLLIVAGMAATVTFIPKFIVKSAPEDIRDKVLARPDYPMWKTIGCKGYEQFGFNLRSQITKMFVFAAVAAAVAGVLTIFV